MFSSLFYFLETAKDMNFTKTARRLYISQQTLSNHIKRLEEYYNAQLFVRKPTLRLTPSGEYLLHYADQVYSNDLTAKNHVSDLEQHNRGVLRVGASLPRGRIFIPDILPEFSRQFPNVQLQFEDDASSVLEKLTLEGKLDLAIGVFPKQHAQLQHIPVLRDQIFLVVTDQLLMQYYGDTAVDLKMKATHGIYVNEISLLPIIYPSVSNRLRSILDDCFEKFDCKPYIYFHVRYPQFFFQLCLDGIAACFVTQMSLLGDYHMIKHPVNIFPVLYDGHPLFHEGSIIHRADAYLTKYTQAFMELAVQYFKNVEHSRAFQLNPI